jgi:hypothetical protein
MPRSQSSARDRPGRVLRRTKRAFATGLLAGGTAVGSVAVRLRQHNVYYTAPSAIVVSRSRRCSNGSRDAPGHWSRPRPCATVMAFCCGNSWLLVDFRSANCSEVLEDPGVSKLGIWRSSPILSGSASGPTPGGSPCSSGRLGRLPLAFDRRAMPRDGVVNVFASGRGCDAVPPASCEWDL